MRATENLPDVLTAGEISLYMGISKGRIYELMRINTEAGGIPTIKIGRNKRVLKSDLIQWLDSMKEASKS